MSYGALAGDLGGGTTAQEVGAAVDRNPLCIVVPCHRVVGAAGRLTGYAGGLARKRFLLDLEQSDQLSLWPPAFDSGSPASGVRRDAMSRRNRTVRSHESVGRGVYHT